ncbi:MAG TPA: DUF6807 family protein [Verrucomicrobiae bacterium]|jgi:hypothetical protein|nr:DUF6807 family protein [Verrucomicrobiae bacterium]
MRFFFALLALAASLTSARAQTVTVEARTQESQWTISYEGKPVLVYAFDPQKFKPYVKALNTLEGEGPLRDAPGDHLHHHALMYGINVNGVNFWEEKSGCGVQKVVESTPPEIGSDADGRPQARLRQVLYWLAPADAFLPKSNAPALLIEHRTLVLTLDAAARETALQWTSEFEVGTKTNRVTLTGANYDGLGMRFLVELDAAATHLTPAGPLDLSNKRQDVSALPWEAVAFDRPRAPLTIALYGAAGNARGESRFFAMKEPFAYLCATQGLDKEALVYQRGEHFVLNYLVVLYPDMKTKDALDARGRQWKAASAR